MSGLGADSPKLRVGVRDHGRTLVRADRLYEFTHIRDPFRIINYDLLRLVRLQIRKFREHLLRIPKIEGGIALLLFEAPPRHDDPPVDIVLRLDIVAVTGRAYRLSKLLPEG